MTLTEVVFEVREADDPLCKITEQAPGTHVLLRVFEPGRSPGSHRALATFCGPQPEAATLARNLHGSRAHEDVEVLYGAPEATTLRFSLRSPESTATPSLLPIARLQEAYGHDSILEPVLVRHGRARIRILLPRSTEAQRALLTFREVQRGAGWRDCRIIRVTTMDARAYLDSIRRVLMPEQEDILRLAVCLGYYDIPKRATLETVASALGLSVSPVHKRLKAIEGVLVGARIEPAGSERPDFRRRPRRGTAVPRPAPITDVALRIRAPSFAPHAFVARTPGSRAIFHHLAGDRAIRESTAFLVANAPDDTHAKLQSELEANIDVRRSDVVSRDREHLALKMRIAMPQGPARPTHPYAWFPEALAHDIVLKPALMEGKDIYARFLVTRPMDQDELLTRIDTLARKGGWEEHEILAVRPLACDAHGAPPAPERMTARQEEVLKISYALGYYRTPRSCTLEGVAGTLGVSANAIHKNLAAAELNVLTSYLSAGI